VGSLGCSGDDEPTSPTTKEDGEAWPGSDWATATPESRDLDGDKLEEARKYAFEDGRNTQGVVVVRRGVVVADWYAPGAAADSWATSWSVAKSFASALVGMAIDEGLIDGVDVPMSRYIPGWVGTAKEKILLRHVLQMAPGLEWNEDYDPNALNTSDVIQLVLKGGQELEFAASKPVVAPPGTVFKYSSGTSMLLSAVIQEATGMTALEYARKKLFAPLGIERADWWQSTAGHTLTFCCVDMTSRDFARFGLLYARGGKWKDQTLVSPEWVSDSSAPSPANAGYGYQWWLLGVQTQTDPGAAAMPSALPPGTFAAIGVDDQIIYVVPALDLVVVRNGTYVKDPGPAVADPQLVVHLPPSGIIEGKGTLAPRDWDIAGFLKLVIAAVRR
jgi:CubicO group peptidase (beta-lactamase class C family)